MNTTLLPRAEELAPLAVEFVMPLALGAVALGWVWRRRARRDEHRVAQHRSRTPGWWDAMLSRFGILLALSLISLALVYPFSIIGDRFWQGVFLFLAAGFVIAALVSVSISIIPALRWLYRHRE